MAHATSAPSSSLLLSFCQYLQYRVKSDNMELLVRIVTELLSEPQRDTTIQSMLFLAFPMIAILPVDNDDAAQRAHASTSLERMRSLRIHDVVNGMRSFRKLQTTLSHQVELKNWDWLAQIFDEFCAGDESCLCAFIKLQRQAIAILPVPPLVSPATNQRVAIPQFVTRPSPGPSNSQNGTLQCKPRSHKTMTPAMRLERARIHSELQAMEDAEPWTVIFYISTIDYPFDAEKHPDLAKNLKQFWLHHARAVWERPFWFKNKPHNPNFASERMIRQRVAQTAFESMVISPCAEALGPQFFSNLDRQDERHHWWWYRRPLVNVLAIGTKCGLEACLSYLQFNATQRFPDPPPGFEVRPDHHRAERTSMWSIQATHESLHLAIARLGGSSVDGID